RRQTTTVAVAAASAVTNGRQRIQSGVVKPILPKDAANVTSSEGFTLLDIRPEWERNKARVADSLHVSLFVNDPDTGPVTLLKKWVHFGYIGLWTGQNFTTMNPDFLKQVEASVPDKNSKLLLACGEGLRSMMAASKLHQGGYTNLGWLLRGFNHADDSDFPGLLGRICEETRRHRENLDSFRGWMSYRVCTSLGLCLCRVCRGVRILVTEMWI
ncbi:Rhodanese-like domain-containing protein 10, partial [Linum grandiflorum]